MISIELMTLTFAVLFIGFQIKQYACDFLLQSHDMFADKITGDDLVSRGRVNHLALHAVGTCLLVALVVGITKTLSPFAALFLMLGAATLDVICHGMTDSWNDSFRHGRGTHQKSYWIVFGLDQMMRHICHFAVIMLVMWTVIAPTMVSQ